MYLQLGAAHHLFACERLVSLNLDIKLIDKQVQQLFMPFYPSYQ